MAKDRLPDTNFGGEEADKARGRQRPWLAPSSAVILGHVVFQPRFRVQLKETLFGIFLRWIFEGRSWCLCIDFKFRLGVPFCHPHRRRSIHTAWQGSLNVYLPTVVDWTRLSSSFGSLRRYASTLNVARCCENQHFASFFPSLSFPTLLAGSSLQGFDVICYCANVGQLKEDFDKVREKALKCGASKVLSAGFYIKK